MNNTTYVCRYVETKPIYPDLMLPHYKIISSKVLSDINLNKESLFFINNSNHRIKRPQMESSNTYFFGRFIDYNEKENEKIRLHNDYCKNITTSNVPSVAIIGVGSNTQKFEIQCSLAQCFRRDLYDVYSLTYNPDGILYGFDYYYFPETIDFPDIVYSINKIVEDHQNADIHLLNIGGGLKYINKYNKNCFGALVSAYLQSTAIDIVIFAVNTSTPLRYVREAIGYFNFYGVSKVFVVISDYTFDEGTYDAPFEIGYYQVDNRKKKAYYKELKKECSNVLLFDDVLSGELYKKIVDSL